MRSRRRSRQASPGFGPVLMTALAMIIGMVPMALGLGEGGEQNAPLGRAGDRRPDARDRRDAHIRTDCICIAAQSQGGLGTGKARTAR